MNMQATTTVSVIGLGNMGHALADSLLAKSFQVTAWNRTRSKAEALERAGASVAPSVAAAAQGTDVMVVCLIDHAATFEAVMTTEVGVAMRGKSLVQLSTTLANEVDELAQWAESYDIGFLKGAIMVYPDDIRAGNGEVLYGGPKYVFDRLQSVLNAMGGRPCLVCERPADTIALTSASYSFLFSALLSFLFGAAICQRSGVSVEAFTHKVIEPFITGGSLMRYLDKAGRAAAIRRYDEDVQATLDVWNDGLRQMIVDVEASAIDPAMLRPLKALLDQTAANGYGQKDIAAVFETLLAEKH